MAEKKETEGKNKVGRPSLYRAEYCEAIIDVMANGYSLEAAAAKMNIPIRCLYDWQNRHPEFSQAVHEGRIKALAWWEERAMATASGAQGNSQIISLGLKNRSRSASGWVDTIKQEISGNDGGPIKVETTNIDVNDLTPEQRDALRAVMVAAKAKSQK
jgi:hypothetical protein